MADNKGVITKDDAKKRVLKADDLKVYNFGKNFMNRVLNLMSSESFFRWGVLMIIFSAMSIFVFLPVVDGKISQIDNEIENESKIIDMLWDKIQSSNYNIGIAYNYMGTSAILNELNASQEIKANITSLQKLFLYRAILQKLNDAEASSFKENEKVIMSLDMNTLVEINNYADENIRLLRYNEHIYKKNYLIQEKTNWLSIEKYAQIISGLLNTIGLLFISFADRNSLSRKTTRGS